MQFRCPGIVRVPPGDDAAPARAATTRGTIGLIKSQSASGQVVDMRRLDDRVPITSDIILGNIVRDKEDKIKGRRRADDAQSRREEDPEEP